MGDVKNWVHLTPHDRLPTVADGRVKKINIGEEKEEQRKNKENQLICRGVKCSV